MSLRLKAVGQQVFKICNRKGRLYGGERGWDAGGQEGERRTEREREGREQQKKRHLLLLVTRERKEKAVLLSLAPHGKESYSQIGRGLPISARICSVVGWRRAVAYARAVACTQGHTETHTHIYMRAQVYICMSGRARGRLSLEGGGGGRGQGTACCAPGRRRITKTLGCREKKKKKGEFSGINMAKRGTLLRTVQPEAPRPAKRPCNALPGSAAGHRRPPFPPQGSGTPMGMGAHAPPPAWCLALL